MKSRILGMFAALLVLGAVGVAQQMEFPQQANPAVKNGTYFEQGPILSERHLPSSMAINESSANAVIAPSSLERRFLVEGGSAFPLAASPSPIRNDFNPPQFENRNLEFPMAANPALQR